MTQEPYIEETEVIVHKRYNPNYGNDRICNCGHPYYRHFDSYDNMENVGCKYCGCHDFKEFVGEYEVVRKFVQDNTPGRYSELLENKERLKDAHNMPEEEAHQVFLEDCLEEHYRITQRITNKLLGKFYIDPNDPDAPDGWHKQDILEE
jgi:hypothetical protein